MNEAQKPRMNLNRACEIGGRPGSMRVSRDGSRLLIFDQNSALMSVVGISGWQILERIDLGLPEDCRPFVLAEFEDSIFLGGLPGKVPALSAASHRIYGSIPCSGDVCDLGFVPEFRRAVLATARGGAGAIEFVGLGPVDPQGSLELPLAPVRQSLALLPRQGMGAVVLAGEGRPEGQIALFECRADSEPCFIHVSGGLRSVVFGPDGRYLYAACHDDSSVAVIDVRERRVLEQVFLAGQPFRLACDPVSRRIWALCEKLGHVAFLDPTDQTIVRRTQLAGLTAGTERIAFSPEGRLAIVPELGGDCLSLLECGSTGSECGELDDCLELGRPIGEIVWSPLGEEVYVAAPSQGTVLRLDVDRGDQEMKDTDLYLMDQLLRQEDTVHEKNPLFPP